jgi:hypothetical protein
MSNVFSLTPDGKPPRIIRFKSGLGPGTLLCVLDPTTNVLIINKYLYDTLDDLQKNRVQRTQAYTITLHDRQLVEGEYDGVVAAE